MSVDYFVALHAANWPTMQAVQQCIDQRGWPVRLGTKDDPRWPFDKIQGSLPVTFESEPLRLEASLVTLSPTESFGYWFDRPPDFRTKDTEVYNVRPADKLKPRDINETLARIGASGVHFDYGDKVFSLSFHSNIKEWQAGFYIMAALIKCFQGYGFELQGGEHGASEYADSLVKEASELKARNSIVHPAQPQSLDRRAYKGDLECEQTPVAGRSRIPLAIIVHNGRVTASTEAYDIDGLHLISQAVAAGTVDSAGMLHFGLTLFTPDAQLRANYRVTLSATGGTLTGTQVWTRATGGDSVTRACTGTVSEVGLPKQ